MKVQNGQGHKQFRPSHLNQEGHGEICEAMRPSQLEDNIWLEQLIARVERCGKALAQTPLDEVPGAREGQMVGG